MRHGTARKLICDRSEERLIPDMKTSLPILVALMLLPHAFSLQCYDCNNSPDFRDEPDCDSSKVEKRKCDKLDQRCVTMNYNYSLGPQNGSLPVEVKKCSRSFACDPQSSNSWCKSYEQAQPGQISNCKFKCCQGDLCNDPNYVAPSPKPVSSGLGLAASFGAILPTLVLTVFAGYE